MGVNINTFRDFTNFISNKVVSGETVTTAQFNVLCNQAQLAIFSRDYQTFVQTGVITNFFQTFLVTNYVAQVNPSTGIVAYPSDLQYVSAVGHYYKQRQYDCELIDNTDFRKISPPNSLNYPTLRHVKYEQQGNGLRFAPTNVGIIYLDYFKKPQEPTWAYTIVNNQQVYNPTTSVDFEWDEFSTNQVASVYLQFIGINLKDVDVSNFALAFTQESKLAI